MAIAQPMATTQPQPRSAWYRIGLLAIGHLTNDSYTHYLSVLLPIVVATYDISLALAALLVTTYQITSSVLQPIMGHLVDTGDRRWFAYVGLALSAIASVSLPLIPSYPLLFLAVMIGGLGSASFHPASATMAVEAAGARRGRMMSIYITAGNLGLALGPIIITAVLALGDLRLVPFLAAPALIVAGLLARDMPPNQASTRREAGPPLTLFGALKSGGIPLAKVLSVVTLRSVLSVGMTALLPVLFEMRGDGRAVGATLLSTYLMTGVLGGLVGGNLSDRFGRIPVVVTSFLLAPPMLWLMLNSSGPLMYITAGLSGFFMSGSWIVMTVKAQELMPRSVGVASGLMLGLSQGIGGLSVSPIAALGEAFGLDRVLNVLIFLPILCAFIAATIDRKPKPRAELAQA